MVHTAYHHINSSEPVLFAALHAHAITLHLVCFGTWTASFWILTSPTDRYKFICLFRRRTSPLWCSYSWTIHDLLSSMSCIYIPGGMSGLNNCNLWLHLITFNKRILFICLVYLNCPDFVTVWYHYQLFTFSVWPRGYTKVLPEIWEDHNTHESMSSSNVLYSLSSFKWGWKQQDGENWQSFSQLCDRINYRTYSPALLR